MDLPQNFPPLFSQVTSGLPPHIPPVSGHSPETYVDLFYLRAIWDGWHTQRRWTGE